MALTGLRGKWVFHPDSPGELVFVVRGFWGRLLKPEHFATLREVRVFKVWRNNNVQRK